MISVAFFRVPVHSLILAWICFGCLPVFSDDIPANSTKLKQDAQTTVVDREIKPSSKQNSQEDQAFSTPELKLSGSYYSMIPFHNLNNRLPTPEEGMSLRIENEFEGRYVNDFAREEHWLELERIKGLTSGHTNEVSVQEK